MENYDFILLLLEASIIFLFGLCAGSFSSALIYRIPQKLNWVSDRSHCPNCNHVLGFYDLLPLFSWVFSGRQCRHCSAPISFIYPLLELLAGFLAICVYFRFGFTPEAGIILLALPFLISLLAIDLKYYILPNQLNLILFFLGCSRLFIASFNNLDIQIYVIAALVYAGLSWILGVLMKKILGKEALGFGDVKFFLVAGLWLGLDPLPYFLMFSGAFGIAFGFFWQKLTQSKLFPFGPSLIVSFYILLLYQGSVIM